MGFDIEKSFIMAERLKQLREEKGLSHEKLSKALFDQYGVKISSDSLINYEVADAGHTKAYKNQGMRVEYLRCLADFYGVSADYILGQINDPCRAPSAIDELGFSEKAVRWFTEINAVKKYGMIWDINPIFENSYFQLLVYSIVDYINATKAEEIYDQIHNQYFDFDNVEYSAEEGKALRKKFDAEILKIAESGQYGPSISTYLRAHNQLWGNDAVAPDLTALIASVSGIAEMSAYGANKYLINLLDNLREVTKKEVSGAIAVKAED